MENDGLQWSKGIISTDALFADDVPEVALPDIPGMPGGSSGGLSLWLWGVLAIAIIAVGGILLLTRRKEE